MVNCRGDAWHRLRQEDFTLIDLDGSPEMLSLIKSMMRTDPVCRVDIETVWAHPVVSRARSAMERMYAAAKAAGTSAFAASPLGSVPSTFLEEILARHVTVDCGRPLDDIAMDVSP